MDSETKHKNWQLTPEQAKQVIKDHRDKAKTKERKHQEQIKKELKVYPPLTEH